MEKIAGGLRTKMPTPFLAVRCPSFWSCCNVSKRDAGDAQAGGHVVLSIQKNASTIILVIFVLVLVMESATDRLRAKAQ